MKKILENFYIISKLGFSLTLFGCLIIILYIFFVYYQKEQILDNSQLNVEEGLKNSINQNLASINKITEEIKINEKLLNEIKNDIKKINNQDNKKDIINLNQNIQSLNENFQLLSTAFEDLKKNKIINKEIDLTSEINKNITEIVDLILIKYENNIKFYQEIEYLKKIINTNQNHIIDKILILSIQPFKGHDYLKKIFDEEVSAYLKEITIKNSESFFNKIILPYIEFSPSARNPILNETILNIKETKYNIENRNLEKALSNLKTINQYENFFELSSTELNKYIKFKNELNRLK